MNQQMLKDENYMFSPFSIRMALGMTLNGADDKTKKEMLSTLGIDDFDAFQTQSKKLMEEYDAMQAAKLQVANAIWSNKDEAPNGFQNEFKKKIETFYHGQVKTTEMKTAVADINSWVSEHTNKKINQLISEEDLPFTALLANAIYFKADWDLNFLKDDTYKDIFTDQNGKQVETDFMHQNEWFRYFEGNGLQMLRLPYKREKDSVQLSMYVILSDQPIDAEYYVKTRKLEEKKVELTLPKFKTEWKKSIKDTLKSMGIKRAFNAPDAFPNMIMNDSALLENVLHETYIQVDESGTEAAAVTAVLIAAGCAPQKIENIVFKADHPFTYVIYDDTNEETLLMGRYAFVNE